MAKSNSGGKPPSSEYEVGYGKPPKATQFPHQTRARSGRKRGSRNWAVLIREELDKTVRIVEGDCETLLSKQEIAVRSLVNRAVKGDLKSLEMALRLGGQDSEPIDASEINPEMVASFLRRHGRASEPGS